MNKKKIIQKLKTQIEGCKSFSEDLNECSWKYETGVLITANEAMFILKSLTEHPEEGKEDYCHACDLYREAKYKYCPFCAKLLI